MTIQTAFQPGVRTRNVEFFDKDGYLRRKIDGIDVLTHILLAEKALGKPLPANAVVHHADGDRSNNVRSNLVVCPDRAYHNLLHKRMRAMASCGNANWLICCRCRNYDSPDNLSLSGNQAYHKKCNRLHVQKMMSRCIQ